MQRHDGERTGIVVPDQPWREGALSLAEIVERYPDEWIWLHFTEEDEDCWPARGYVIAHSTRQQALLDAIEHVPRSSLPAPISELPSYVWWAQPEMVPGPAYEAAVQRFLADLTKRRIVDG